MAVTASSLKTRYPSTFPASFDDAVLTAAISEAEQRNEQAALGADYDLAIQYLAAHLALSDARARRDGVKSAGAGGVNVTFAELSAQANEFLGLYEALLRAKTPGLAISG